MKTLQIGLEWFSERAGGLPRYYFDLFHHAAAQGIEFRGLVVGSTNVARESNGAVEAFSPIARAPLTRLWAARSAVKRLLTEYQPDLVASHFAFHAFPALDLIDRPLVNHFHGPWAHESSNGQSLTIACRVKARMEAMVYRKAQRHIVLSKAFGEILNRTYAIPWERIRVVPGAANVDRFNIAASPLEARVRLRWPLDRPIILAVRRLVRRMGLENLIKAVAQVARRHPDVLLVIGGKGPLSADLKKLVADLNLENHVRFLGFIKDEDLPLAYRAATFSIVPSVALEGFGLIAAESLAAGTPVLVTPVGGLPEVVKPLCEALVMAGWTPEDICEGICGFFGQQTLPDRNSCATYARDNFSWLSASRKLKAIYKEAVAQMN
jgi:glycosyltransferase involved in cell wall biosynthesis